MPLSILNDAEIRALLESMGREDFEVLITELRYALHEYSTNTQSIDASLLHQPKRTVIRSSRTGATTLFMPSCSPVAHGVKVVTLAEAHRQLADPGPAIRPTGAITLFSSDGTPRGILHTSTLTAFRAALASAYLLLLRSNVRTITVFGCGDQAYWHVRLALVLRGSTIKHVHFINHRFSESCRSIFQRFVHVPLSIKQAEGWEETRFGILTPGYGEYSRLLHEQLVAADVIFCCTPSTEPLFDAAILTSHEARRKGRLIVAVGSFTPLMRELPVDLLRQATKTHEKGHYHFHKHALEGGVIVVDTLDGALNYAGEVIDAQLEPKQLVELGELAMIHGIRSAQDDQPEESESASGSIPPAEFEKLDLGSSEASGSAMSRVFGHSRTPSSSRTSSPSRSSGRFSIHHRRSHSQGSVDQQKQKDDHFARWLDKGNVIYKSVGLGLMDLTVGLRLMEVAKERGIGKHIDDF